MSVVLVVDDDPDNLSLLEARLQRMGHQVHPVGSAIEAMRVLDRHGPPDLAVVDIVMNRISGLQLLRLLRQDDAYASMPAILVTARELETDLLDARALNAQLMKKPIVTGDLSAAVGAALLPAGS